MTDRELELRKLLKETFGEEKAKDILKPLDKVNKMLESNETPAKPQPQPLRQTGG